jgi:hypothetical protein
MARFGDVKGDGMLYFAAPRGYPRQLRRGGRREMGKIIEERKEFGEL